MSRSTCLVILALASTGCVYPVTVDLPVSDSGIADWHIQHSAPVVFGDVGDAGSLANPFGVLFERRAHVFAQANGTLTWCDNAFDCTWQTLDGVGGSDGRVVGTVARDCIVATSWAGSLHVFYRQDAAASQALRHGTYSNHRWRFETMVQPPTTGGCPAVLVTSKLLLGVRDHSRRSLRLMSHDTYAWAFGAEFNNGDDVGVWAAIAASEEQQFVFHSDDTINGLVESRYESTGWVHQTREILEGPLRSRPVAVTSGGVAHVFFQDSVRGDVIHGRSDGEWHSEPIDGHADQRGVTPNTVGAFGIAATEDLEVFYYDATAGDLRHAQATDAGWRYERLDGEDADVGRSPTALKLDGGILVIYEGEHGRIRRALIP